MAKKRRMNAEQQVKIVDLTKEMPRVDDDIDILIDDDDSEQLYSIDDMRTLAERPRRKAEWLWKQWVPVGYVTLLAGPSEVGKTTLAYDLMARVTRGLPMPFGAEPVEPGLVALLSTEEVIDITANAKLEAAGADLARVLPPEQATLIDHGPERLNPLKNLQREAFYNYLDRQQDRLGLPVRLIVLDALGSYSDGKDLNKVAHAREVIEAAEEIARDRNCAFIVVHHFNKKTDVEGLNRISGSHGLTNVVRSVLIALKDPAYEAPEDLPDDAEMPPALCYLVAEKVSLARHPRALSYKTVGKDISDGRNEAKTDWMHVTRYFFEYDIKKDRKPKDEKEIAAKTSRELAEQEILSCLGVRAVPSDVLERHARSVCGKNVFEEVRARLFKKGIIVKQKIKHGSKERWWWAMNDVDIEAEAKKWVAAEKEAEEKYL